jgi:glycosyltransferase involved in cell wall biosynthesis
MSKPILSFCIPTYNRANCVEQCVKWILEHPGDDIEIVVSDNASSDDTKERLSQIRDLRLKYFRNEKNEGFGYNLDRVLSESSGDYCFLISDEDEVNINKISKLIEIIRQNLNLAVIFGNVVSADYRSMVESENERDLQRRLAAGIRAIEEMSFKHAYLSGIIVNKELYGQVKESVDWYQKDLFYPHEYLCFLLAFLGEILIINDTIVFTHEYGNRTYSGNGTISSAYSFEGRLRTCKDRTLIINEKIDNIELKEKLILENFTHMMTAATAGEHLIFISNNKSSMQVNSKEQNLQKAISKFVDEFNLFVSSERIYFSKSFYNKAKKRCIILRLKVIGIHFYGSSIYKMAKVIFDKL